MDKTEIQKILYKTEHPEINSNLIELGMINILDVDETDVNLQLKLPFKEVPIKDELIATIKDAINQAEKKLRVNIEIIEMNEEEKMRFMKIAREKWAF